MQERNIRRIMLAALAVLAGARVLSRRSARSSKQKLRFPFPDEAV